LQNNTNFFIDEFDYNDHIHEDPEPPAEDIYFFSDSELNELEDEANSVDIYLESAIASGYLLNRRMI
jgi:hypothetical protein